MQWTRTASLCSPLTPTVRRACAAPQLTSERSTSSANNRANRQTRTAHPDVTTARQARPSLQHRTEPVRRRRGLRHFAGPRGRPPPGLTSRTSLRSHRSRRTSSVPAHVSRRRSGPGGSAPHPGPSPPRQGNRKRRNAQLHSTVYVRVRPAHSPHPRGRPRAVPRSPASRVSLYPPRSHSVAPNPGVQWTRCARH